MFQVNYTDTKWHHHVDAVQNYQQMQQKTVIKISIECLLLNKFLSLF